ncbi:MAG: hypothetical protein KIT19_14770 [Phycisphaeraceae bacterium]|nr:hypothetical protein [Phycisphaeraceae bacterium]
MSVLVQIADAVAASINAAAADGVFPEPLEAVRAHRPSFDLEELDELRVSVVPRSTVITALARLQSQYECTVDVGIQQRVPAGDGGDGRDARVDALLELAEAVGDHLRHKRLPEFPEAAWSSIAHDPVLAPEHLDERSTLTTVLSVTYRVRR